MSRLGDFIALVLMLTAGAGGVYFLVQQRREVEQTTAANSTDRQQLLAIVRHNADDPSDLEIVTWGERFDKHRSVTFRCNRVGLLRTGRLKPPVGPVMLEHATAEYEGEHIVRLHLAKTHQVWHAD